MSEFKLQKTLAEIESLGAMGMTETQVAEKLNSQGFKTGTGKEWTRGRLSVFKAYHRKGRRRLSARPTLKIPKLAKKPEALSMADDLAVLALKRSDWSDKKKLKVVAAILAD